MIKVRIIKRSTNKILTSLESRIIALLSTRKRGIEYEILTLHFMYCVSRGQVLHSVNKARPIVYIDVLQ